MFRAPGSMARSPSSMIKSQSSNYGSFGKNYVNGINFLEGDYDIKVPCADFLLSGLALVATAFFYATYTAITTGRKKRSVGYVQTPFPLLSFIPLISMYVTYYLICVDIFAINFRFQNYFWPFMQPWVASSSLFNGSEWMCIFLRNRVHTVQNHKNAP